MPFECLSESRMTERLALKHALERAVRADDVAHPYDGYDNRVLIDRPLVIKLRHVRVAMRDQRQVLRVEVVHVRGRAPAGAVIDDIGGLVLERRETSSRSILLGRVTLEILQRLLVIREVDVVGDDE